MQKKTIKTDSGDIAIYHSGKGFEVQVRVLGETLWLTQAQVADLFGAERSVVTKHIRNIFNSKELEEKTVCAKFAHTAKDQSFRSTMGAIYQSFDGKDLYPSIEEKAAHLLYFTVKNHSFVDGNKRIAAFLFIWFLRYYGALYRPDGSKRIADNALVALCLMTAECKPDEKDLIITVIVNLINRNN